jgi:hypothetical protein
MTQGQFISKTQQHDPGADIAMAVLKPGQAQDSSLSPVTRKIGQVFSVVTGPLKGPIVGFLLPQVIPSVAFAFARSNELVGMIDSIQCAMTAWQVVITFQTPAAPLGKSTLNLERSGFDRPTGLMRNSLRGSTQFL